MSDGRRAAPEGAEFQDFSGFYQNSVYAAFQQEHRCGGSFGQKLFKVEQEPIDLIDTGVPDFIVTVARRGVGPGAVDVGDGLKHFPKLEANAVCLYPTAADARTIVSTSHKILNFNMPRTYVDAWLRDLGVTYDPFGAFYGHLSMAPEPLQVLEAIWRAAETPDGMDNLIIDGLTMQLLAQLADLGRNQLSMADFSGRPDRRIRRAVDYIESHINHPFGVAELAEVACLSTTHFSRAFKSVTGETVRAFVRRRVESARVALTSSNEPIARIAEACGFADASHLTRAMKAAFNRTPGEVRRESRM